MPQPTALDLQTGQFTDIADYADAWSDVFDGRMQQLDAGCLAIDSSVLRFEDLAIEDVGINRATLLEGEFQAGWTVFMLATDAADATANWCGTTVRPGTLTVLRPGREHQLRCAAGWNDLVFVVDDDLLTRRGLAPDEFIDAAMDPTRAHLPLAPAHAQRMSIRLRRLMHDAVPSESSDGKTRRTEHFRESAIDELAQAIEVGMHNQAYAGRVRSCRRYELVRRAVRFINEQPDAFLTAETLGEELGTSLWSLQRAFRKVLNVSPYQYLLRTRLHAARTQLRDYKANRKIADVAAEFNFASSSEFSRHYRRFYAELPSATRRRNH